MSVISIQPDLLKLKGAQLLRDKDGIGYLKIPIDESGLQVFTRKEGYGCTLPIIVREKSDNYGNDFLVTRGYSKAETEFNKTAPEGQKKQTEILGNGKYLVKPQPTIQETDTSDFAQETDPEGMPF